MLLKRGALKHTPKTIRNKVQFNLCCKLVKKMLREHNLQKMRALITQVMEKTKRTKKI